MNYLTQRALIQRLRDELEIHVDSPRIHAWVRAGMPTIPGGKKPRFIWERCQAWILGSQETDPLALEVRDRMLGRRYKGIS